MKKRHTKSQQQNSPEIFVSTVWDQKGLPQGNSSSSNKKEKKQNPLPLDDKRWLYPNNSNKSRTFTDAFKERLKEGFLFVAKTNHLMVYLEADGASIEIKANEIVMSLGVTRDADTGDEKMNFLYFDKTWAFDPFSLMHTHFFRYFKRQETS